MELRGMRASCRLLLAAALASAAAAATTPVLAQSADVSGNWTVTFGGTDRMSLVLQQRGTTVTGTLHATDHSRGAVTGTFDGTTLVLSRDTGLETIQRYRVTVDGDRFSGSYVNEGKYAASGTFTGVRDNGPGVTPPAPSVSGTWTVTFGGKDRMKLVLQQQGTTVTGTLDATDHSRGAVTGTFDGTTLVLSRDTGLETIQRYRVTVDGNRFSGSYENEGKYAASGTFTGVRDAAPAVAPPPAANVSGTWTVTFGGTDRMSLVLHQDGTTVTGTLDATDHSRGAVTGVFDGTTLVMSRDTGLETIQRYRVTVNGDRFSGSYVNEGKYAASGSFTGVRNK